MSVIRNIGGAAPETVALGALTSIATGAFVTTPAVQIISAIALALYPIVGMIARQLRNRNPVINIPKEQK
jgi:hypothetical protein